jgi:phosphonoacetaldehyde hydrolase
MALKSLEQLNVYPVEAAIKIGDTVPDIAEGLNAGMWTIGVPRAFSDEEIDQPLGLSIPSADESGGVPATGKRCRL